MAYSATAAALRAWRESKDDHVQQRRALQRKMASSRSFPEWTLAAAKLDRLDGHDEEARWRSETRHYDRRLLEEKLAHLRAVRAADAPVAERMFAVRADLLRNLGNMASAALHEHFPLVPGPIREYIDEVRTHLIDITHANELVLTERAAFLKETRHAFGRTALVLSGGGALGTFHLGVVKALLEHRLLPRVVAGSATGAVVGALTATRTDAELSMMLQDVEAWDLALFSTPGACSGGGCADARGDALLQRLRHMLGDFTFLEAYTHTGRVLNLSVAAAGAAEPPRLLNYLTAPHVLVWSAVACSSAFPGLGAGRQLLARSSNGEMVPFAAGGDVAGATGSVGAGAAGGWHDGSLEDDLPMRGLSEMFSVNHFIVSQSTPHIIPFLALKKSLGVVGALAEGEIKHRCRQALELLPRRRWPARWLRAFSQPWEGDITITLPDAVAQLARGVAGASRRHLIAALRQGEAATWAKMSAVQCNCGIEATLDECIQQVAAWEREEAKERRAAAQAAVKPLRAVGRLPSWADLDSLHRHGVLGMSSSTESLLSLAPVAAAVAATLGGGSPRAAASGRWSVAATVVQRPGSAPAGGSASGSPETCAEPAVAAAEASTPSDYLTPEASIRSGHIPDSAYDCIDSSANAFSEGALSPLSVVGDSTGGGGGSRASQRNSLDVIAP